MSRLLTLAARREKVYDTAMKTTLEKIREKMREYGADAYLVTGSDAHMSEYTAAYWGMRAFVCGFAGSAGFVFITPKSACLITDGRYFIQAKNELAPGFELVKAKSSGEAELLDLIGKLGKNGVLAFDYRTVSSALLAKIKDKISQTYDSDIAGELWEDRPALVFNKVYAHPLKYAGEDTAAKIKRIRSEIKKTGADAYLVTALDDIAWLFNLRGGDIPYTPVAYAYAVVGITGADLFLGAADIDGELKTALVKAGVTLSNYNETEDFLSGTAPCRIITDAERTNVRLYEILRRRDFSVINHNGLAAGIKTVKSRTEIKNIADCHIQDGAAVTKFIIWLKTQADCLDIREHEIHGMLAEYRSGLPGYISPSFQTIAAFMENAAVMHYAPKPGTDKKITDNGLLLIDTGAQYKGGTTDITRTVILGDVPDELKRDYTLVVKSHIALMSAVFPENTTGAALDAIARAPIWAAGLDYNSGTGHGLGYCLCVHEPPARIAKTSVAAIKKGMAVTVEPGIYREGEWGIRTENAAVVVKAFENEHGVFLRFKPLSFCPIDLDGIIPEMLTDAEKAWLNAYHTEARKKITPLLRGEEKEALRVYTRKME